MTTIQELKQKGYKVCVSHYRNAGGPEPIRTHVIRANGLPFYPKGGKTVVEIQKDGETFIGEAECSEKDSFCYRVGRNVALGRALAQM